MSDPSGRLLRLLGLLQRRATWSAVDLAERLEVDTRTVWRDVDKLRALGYQIRGIPEPGAATGSRAARRSRRFCSRTTKLWRLRSYWAYRRQLRCLASNVERLRL